MPTSILIDTGVAGGVGGAAVLASLERLEEGLESDPEVVSVRVGSGPHFVDAAGRHLHVQAIGKSEYGLPESLAFARRLRSDIIPAAAFPAGVQVLAGGGPPSASTSSPRPTGRSRGSCSACSC